MNTQRAKQDGGQTVRVPRPTIDEDICSRTPGDGVVHQASVRENRIVWRNISSVNDTGDRGRRHTQHCICGPRYSSLSIEKTPTEDSGTQLP